MKQFKKSPPLTPNISTSFKKAENSKMLDHYLTSLECLTLLCFVRPEGQSESFHFTIKGTYNNVPNSVRCQMYFLLFTFSNSLTLSLPALTRDTTSLFLYLSISLSFLSPPLSLILSLSLSVYNFTRLLLPIFDCCK